MRLLIGKIVRCTALILPVLGIAQTEARELVRSDAAVARTAGTACARIVAIDVEAKRPKYFKPPRVALQELVGGVRAVLSFECPTAKQLTIRGVFDGREMFTGVASATQGWMVRELPRRGTSAGSNRRLPTDPGVVDRDTVRAIQRELARHGQNVGHIDGIWGSRSARAFESLRARHSGLRSREPGNAMLAELRRLPQPAPRQAAAATAEPRCGPVAQEYSAHPFGGVLHALAVPCERRFSPKEQVFVAGYTQTLLSECNDLRIGPATRGRLLTFLSSSAMVGVIGRQYANPNLSQGLGDQAASGLAYGVGESTARDMGCGGESQAMLNSVAHYLEKTSHAPADGPDYVGGCARHYAGRYTRQQCQCLADIGRAVYPDIHRTRFSSASIKSIINSNPFVGIQIAFQCRIGDY